MCGARGQPGVDQRRLAVIHVRDDRNIPDVLAHARLGDRLHAKARDAAHRSGLLHPWHALRHVVGVGAHEKARGYQRLHGRRKRVARGDCYLCCLSSRPPPGSFSLRTSLA
eukprot:1974524-Prymnesium_polylepis.1